MNETTEEVVRPNEPEVESALDELWDTDNDPVIEAQVEDTTTEEPKVDTPVEKEETVLDYNPLLESLSKELKYMDEEVKISDLEELKTLVQKGKDYDRKTAKLEELSKSEELQWLDAKAKENGMTRKEYIEAVKTYEKEQEKAKEQEEIEALMDGGMPEELAQKVIETNRVAKELAAEKAKMKEQEAVKERELAKEKEQERFLEAYPDVEIKSIPNEVFKEAEQTSLLEAYTRYKNAELVKEMEVLKQNLKNKETSPVSGTQTHGVTEKVDPADKYWNED